MLVSIEILIPKEVNSPRYYLEDPITAFPTFWTEVYNRSLQEWITIDPVRNKVRCKKGEMDNGRLFYVVAYEVDQYVKDVTPRYARSFAGRTLKMRIQSRRKDDPDWWEELIRPWSRPFLLGREKKEDDELMKQQETEPMPTIIEGFKNHPRYALERHLKREEALPARTRQLGLFRGEPVYPRSAVIPVKSSETWMREGRKIREGEQALKMVKQRAVTINKRRAQEMAQQEGLEPVMQGLYSASQTELVIPPPIIDVRWASDALPAYTDPTLHIIRAKSPKIRMAISIFSRHTCCPGGPFIFHVSFSM